MRKFFDNNIGKSQTRPDGKVYSCASCGLYKGVLSPKMKPYGKGKLRILNIGEAPGETEDRRNKQWQGKAGERLKREYAKFDIDLFEDCVNINSVNCRPPENRTPTDYEIACCRKNVLKVINDFNPHIIVLLGNPAIMSIIGHRWKKDLGGINKWRGWAIPDRDFNTWIMPVFHPSFVMRNDNPETDKVWNLDFKRIAETINKPFSKYQNDIDCVYLLNEIKDIKRFLKGLIKKAEKEVFKIAFDYEATGLKLHLPEHKIVCVSVAVNAFESFVFEIYDEIKELFKKVLTHPNILKEAANIKYENTATQLKLGYEVTPWYFDTMQAAHILDNRPGITRLKFQTYVRFGVVDYDSHIEPHLKGKEKGGNSFNDLADEKILNRIKKELMIYCGLDSLYEYRLAEIQMKELGMA